MIESAILLSLLASAPAPLVASGSPGAQDDWSGWRGPGGNGVATGPLPIQWSEEENVRWKVPIPGKGLSSPVALDGRIYLTTAVATGEAQPAPEPQAGGRGGRGGRGAPPVEQDFLVLAFDHASGEVLWETVVTTATPHEGTHPDGSFASPTLTTDGERLYASFGSTGIFALDLEGEVLWQTDLGDMSIANSFGEGSSPALAGDKLILLWQHNGDSFLAALNAADGKEAWRQPRESGTSWCTPTCVETAEGTVVVVPGSTTTAYRAKDGEVVWTYAAVEAPRPEEAGGERGGRGGGRGGRGGRGGGGSSGVAASAVAEAGVVYLSTSSRGGSFVALAVEPKEAGPDGKSGPLLWQHAGDTPYIPSPILYDGVLYSLKSNSAILSALDAATGKVLYEGQRLDRLGDSYASPIAADGKLYFFSRDGTCEVVRAGKDFETLAVNVIEDGIDASPCVVGNTLVLRGGQHLYCIEAK